MNTELKDLSYRSEIDGLRAIAIMAVLLYHTNLGVPGGFAGVDVFFVISGFLISSQIINELNANSFSFIRFWERRVRRIAPAMIVMVFGVLIAGWFILFPLDFANLGKATLFQSLFSANIYSYKDSGYFTASAIQKPLLHCWSLALEEQFYCFMPFFLWLLYLKKTARSPIIITSCILLLSFILCIIGTSVKPWATFYLLPTRAWELMIGTLICLIPIGAGVPKNRLIRESFSILGLTGILLAFFTFSNSTKFPGIAAALPVLGTALIIHVNRRGSGEKISTLIGVALSVKPLVFIGLISYSLYLWHWPIIVFFHQISLTPPNRVSMISATILSFVCAIVSWKYIETPFRRKKLAPNKTIFVWTGISLLVLALCGTTLFLLKGLPFRFSQQVNNYISPLKTKFFWLNLTLLDAQQGYFYPIGYQKPTSKPTILIWGDSHAMAVIPAFDKFLENHKLTGIGAIHKITPPVLTWYYTVNNDFNEEAPAYNQAVVDYAIKNGITHVCMVSSWTSYNKGNNAIQGITFHTAILKTITLLKSHGISVFFMLDVPRPTMDVPRLLARTTISNENIRKYLPTPQSTDYYDNFDPAFLKEIQLSGATILNFKDAFFSEAKDTYLIEKNGQALYSDNNHVSTNGALLMILPYLESHLYTFLAK